MIKTKRRSFLTTLASALLSPFVVKAVPKKPYNPTIPRRRTIPIQGTTRVYYTEQAYTQQPYPIQSLRYWDDRTRCWRTLDD